MNALFTLHQQPSLAFVLLQFTCSEGADRLVFHDDAVGPAGATPLLGVAAAVSLGAGETFPHLVCAWPHRHRLALRLQHRHRLLH